MASNIPDSELSSNSDEENFTQTAQQVSTLSLTQDCQPVPPEDNDSAPLPQPANIHVEDNSLINIEKQEPETAMEELYQEFIHSNNEVQIEENDRTFQDNGVEDLALDIRVDSNIIPYYGDLSEDKPCFGKISPVSQQCFKELKSLLEEHGVQHSSVTPLPGLKAVISGTNVERLQGEIKEIFARSELREVRVQNVKLCEEIPFIQLFSRIIAEFSKPGRTTIQRIVGCELLATAKYKESTNSMQQATFSIVPAHLLHSDSTETDLPTFMMNPVETTAKELSYRSDDGQNYKLQYMSISKYQITTKSQDEHQGQTHMNDMALVKFEKKPEQASGPKVKPFSVPTKSCITFLERKQQVIRIGGCQGRIIPSPEMVGADCMNFGLHIAFVLTSISSQTTGFAEGDSGKVVHIQDKNGMWMPIAMLVGKYSIEVPEYGSSIYIGIILSEALSGIERDFRDRISDIQLIPTDDIYSGEEYKLASDECLVIRSAGEWHKRKYRLGSCYVKTLDLNCSNIISSDDFERIKELEFLKVLKLKFYILPIWPIRLHTLTNLEDLDVSGNRFEASEVLGLKNLVSLKRLALKNCQLTKLPPGLHTLTNLEDLDLSGNRFEADTVIGLENLVALKRLDLSRSQLTKPPSGLHTLTNLEDLDLSGNRFEASEVLGLKNLVSLKRLALKNCQLTKLPPGLHTLTKLEYLNLSSNRFEADTVLGLENMVDLERLALRNCQLTKLPSGFRQMKSLRILDLSRNSLKEFLSELCSLGNLQHIDISYNRQLSTLSPDVQKWIKDRKVKVVSHHHMHILRPVSIVAKDVPAFTDYLSEELGYMGSRLTGFLSDARGDFPSRPSRGSLSDVREKIYQPPPKFGDILSDERKDFLSRYGGILSDEREKIYQPLPISRAAGKHPLLDSTHSDTVIKKSKGEPLQTIEISRKEPAQEPQN